MDIATRAKVSYGAFYHYFDSKEQIFREVAEAQEDRLSAPPDPNGATGPARHHTPRATSVGQTSGTWKGTVARLALMGVIEQVSCYDSLCERARTGEA